MQLDPLAHVPELQAAIDYNPLVVTPDVKLVTVTTLMSEKSNSSLNNSSNDISSESNQNLHPSCALVMEGDKLLGIFTERDIVRHTANGVNFDAVAVGEVMTENVITLPVNVFRDIFGPLFLFRRYGIRHLPIVGDKGELLGVVSYDSVRNVLKPIDFLKLRRVSEAVTTPVITVDMKSSVRDVVDLMAFHQVSCVVITQETEIDSDEVRSTPVGIITERDIVQFQALRLNMSSLKAELVMSTPLYLLTPEDTLWAAHEEMQRRHVRRLVVSWDWGKKIGIITLTGILRILDPLEMYGVYDLSSKTQQKQQKQKVAGLLQQKNQVLSQLKILASETQSSLEDLTDDLSAGEKSIPPHLESALKNMQQIQDLLLTLDGDLGFRKIPSRDSPKGYQLPEELKKNDSRKISRIKSRQKTLAWN